MGQQNKDAQVMEWVKRMTELKEKAGELAQKKDEKKSKKKGGGDPEALKKLKEEIEDHKLKLKTEFGYTKSDINKDEDVIEMTKHLNAMKARAREPGHDQRQRAPRPEQSAWPGATCAHTEGSESASPSRWRFRRGIF